MDIKIRGQENHVVISGETIKEIIIYGDGVVYFKDDVWKFPEYKENGRGLYTEVYQGTPVTLYLEKEPVRAIKENLKRKDNYWKKYHGKYSWETGISLYIHVSEIQVQDDGEKLAFQSDDEKCYLHAYTLHNPSGFVMMRYHVEEVEGAGPDWKPPEGSKWGKGYGKKDDPVYDISTHYLTGETRVLKRWTEPETIYNLITKAGPYCRIEESDFRRTAREVAKTLNENKVFHKEVSHYEIERLLKIYDLTKKGG